MDATAVMADCQTDSLEINYDALEVAITEKTKAIIPVDIVVSLAITIAFSPLLIVRRTSSNLLMRFRKSLVELHRS